MQKMKMKQKQKVKNQLKELIDKNNESFSNLGATAIQGSANLKIRMNLKIKEKDFGKSLKRK